MDECNALAAWAEALPVQAPEAASDNFILNRLAYMQAALPARGVDEDAGEKRTAVYLSVLRGSSKPALSYMVDRACRELRWFPVPADMLKLLREYRAPLTERETTLLLCSGFRQGALERWLDNVRDGQPLGDVPDSWLRIGECQGYVRRLDDGSYVSRALYHSNCWR